MPIFEYRCQACGFEFEKFRNQANKDLVSCPKCGARADRRMSVVNHSFGWRLDDQSHIRGHRDNLEKDV